MWKLSILFWVCFFSLCFSKVYGAFNWQIYDKNHDSKNVPVYGLDDSEEKPFQGWLFGFLPNSINGQGISKDSNNVFNGRIQRAGVYYAVFYAVDISPDYDDNYQYFLRYYLGGKYNGWCVFREDLRGVQPDAITVIYSSDLSIWDGVGLYGNSSDVDGKVPINPGAGLNIFDYSYSMPRSKYDQDYQSSHYMAFFKSLEVNGENKGQPVSPLTIDLPPGVSSDMYTRSVRLFQTSDFSAFLVEQLRRLSSAYDSDGGGCPDFQEWDGLSVGLVYYWNDPADDLQYIPGVQKVEVVGGQDVGTLDPPYFEGPPSFNMPDSFPLGPDSSDWSSKFQAMTSALRDKLEPLRGRFSPLFEDLQEVSSVHRVQFESKNSIGFESSIPVDLSFDFSGGSLGSSVVSALSIIRAVLVVLIYAVLIWVIFCDITKRESSKDD